LETFLKHIIFAFSLGVAIGAEITHFTFEYKVYVTLILTYYYFHTKMKLFIITDVHR